jgi:hypothetical protein
MPYIKTCVDYFRTLNPRSYCKESKTWRFGNKDYNDVEKFLAKYGASIQYGHIKKPVDMIINDADFKIIFKAYVDRFDMFRIHPYHYSKEERSCTYPIEKLEELKVKLNAINLEVTTIDNRKKESSAVENSAKENSDNKSDNDQAPKCMTVSDYPQSSQYRPMLMNLINCNKIIQKDDKNLAYDTPDNYPSTPKTAKKFDEYKEPNKISRKAPVRKIKF